MCKEYKNVIKLFSLLYAKYVYNEDEMYMWIINLFPRNYVCNYLGILNFIFEYI
jgi:hypothetical protein